MDLVFIRWDQVKAKNSIKNWHNFPLKKKRFLTILFCSYHLVIRKLIDQLQRYVSHLHVFSHKLLLPVCWFQNALKQLLPLPEVDVLAHRICDLMTGQISTNNTVTFEGYIHCAAVMINGMLEDKATQLIYMAKGRRGAATYEELFYVCIIFKRISFIYGSFTT